MERIMPGHKRRKTTVTQTRDSRGVTVSYKPANYLRTGWRKTYDGPRLIRYTHSPSGNELVGQRVDSNDGYSKGQLNRQGYGWVSSHRTGVVEPNKEALKIGMMRFMRSHPNG